MDLRINYCNDSVLRVAISVSKKSEFPKPFVQRLVSTRGLPFLKHRRVIAPAWGGPDLKIAVASDFHVIAPWVTLDDIRRISDQINSLQADIIVLAGDFLPGRFLPGIRANAEQIIEAFGGLRAPLGVFAILGNHDWSDCRLALDTDFRENSVINALSQSNFQLLQNAAQQLTHEGHPFWLVGVDSQRPTITQKDLSFHDPDRAYAGVPSDANSILLAHEPDYFGRGDKRPILQISGHTHGGQMNLLGWRPMTPSIYGDRFAYGHFQDADRHLVVSGGVGFSNLPLRIAQPPEVTLIHLGGRP